MSKIQFIAIDCDGTLLKNDMTISDENKKAIQYAKKKGVHVALCSGRSYASLKRFSIEVGISEPNEYIISFNGGLIIDAHTGLEVKKSLLSSKTAFHIIREIKKHLDTRFDLVIYHKIHDVLVERFSTYNTKYAKAVNVNLHLIDDFEKNINDDIYKVLIVGEYEALLEIENHFNKIKDEQFNYFFSANHLLEFLNIEATKANGIRYIANQLNLDINNTMAIGDHWNDLSMIKEAGIGVAMRNGHESIKTFADFVTTKDNNDNGVAEAIYHFI